MTPRKTYFFAMAALMLITLSLSLLGCREDQLSYDTGLKVSFSRSKLSFDTVFTTLGSSTKQVMVYNNNKNAVEISRVWMSGGTNSFFHINLDGENDLSQMSGMEIRGGDSLFMFVRVEVDPQNSNNPVLIEDAVNILVNGNTCSLSLEAYGQDVIKLRPRKGHRIDTTEVVMTSDKPYLLYDSLCINGPWTMNAGARLYMHSGAAVIAEGNVTMKGEKSKPVRIIGDRIDRLFDSVPYAYAAGGWNGIYLMPPTNSTPTYSFDYAEIMSGTVGLFYYDTISTTKPTLALRNCRIHNHSRYGVVLHNIEDSIVNCELSNCASYTLYLGKGAHRIIHTTVADYFRYTTINIQSTRRTDDPAVLVDNTETIDSLVILNSLFTGVYGECLAFADTVREDFKARYAGNYLRPDSAHNVFRQSFYKYKEYKYYDFHLDSLSPARGVADSLTATHYHLDRDEHDRFPIGEQKADAGCYQYHE
ncbi:MAG: hypothetical protein J6W92_03375 [Paludibacteraceae bacterium]|nr:hypothetical protein [Paludibacteraceae bacterium]